MRRQLVKLLSDAVCEINNEQQLSLQIDVIFGEWCVIIHDDKRKVKIFGYSFDINDSVACSICRDKAICSEVLKNNSISSVYHKAFFRHDCFTELSDYCHDIGYPVVVKQNDGGTGNNILYTGDYGSLKTNVDKIFSQYNILSISRYEEIEDEYRFLMINNNLELCYKKIRQHVVGDGFSTVKDLLVATNITPTVDLDSCYIPSVNEVVITNWQHNLSKGAVPEVVEDIDEDMLSLAIKTTQALDLKAGCVDIIVTRQKQKKVLEVNSGIMMDNFSQCRKTDYDYYNIAKKIYKKILLESLKIY
ncbi:MAG: hypothetical protein II393_04710 [Cytophagales bacterium]|nr:hypothetical protein [Cytophagales bacterium]